MAQEGTQQSEGNRYIVIARVDTKYEDCRVIPENDPFLQTHRKVFGPDTKQKCEEWKSQNCSPSKA